MPRLAYPWWRRLEGAFGQQGSAGMAPQASSSPSSLPHPPPGWTRHNASPSLRSWAFVGPGALLGSMPWSMAFKSL